MMTSSTVKGQTYLKSLIPIGDHERIFPYKINTISSRQVMRIMKNID